MAKRRNAPALFELLRETNSTRTGQIGGEQLRTQLGGGTVKNAAPRTPGHPSLTEKPDTPEEPLTPAAKVASEAVVESKPKSATTEAPQEPIGADTDPLLSMPTFKAGRNVPAKPEPAPEATKVSAPAPEAKPVKKTEAKPEAPKPKAPPPEAVVTPAPVEPVKVEPPKAKPEPKPEVMPEPTPVTEAAADEGSDPTPTAGEFDQEKYPLMKRVGNQMTFSTFAVGMIVTAVPVIILVAYLIGTLVGSSSTKRDLEPMLRDQAQSGFSGLDSEPATNNTDEGSLSDPLNLAQDPKFTSPQGVVPETTPTPQDQEPVEQANQSNEPADTVQITNEDTRTLDWNYLHLAPLADPEEALRLQKFLAENGIESFVREVYRGGRLVHEVVTLVGIPAEGWSTSTKKITHEDEVKRLGGIWFREFGGSIDYSRENQLIWYKYKEN